MTSLPFPDSSGDDLKDRGGAHHVREGWKGIVLRTCHRRGKEEEDPARRLDPAAADKEAATEVLGIAPDVGGSTEGGGEERRSSRRRG
jgi:hypothetical protein